HLARDRRTEEKAAGLDAQDLVGPGAPERIGHRAHGGVEGVRRREERRDVAEEDPRRREVGHVADERAEVGQRGRHRLTSNAESPSAAASSTTTWSTREPEGPRESRARYSPTAFSSPSATVSTVPSARLRTQPKTPRDRALRSANQRKPTPWTRPWTTARRAV